MGQQNRVIAAGYQMIGSERLPRTPQRCLGAVSDGVIIHPPRGGTRRFGQTRMGRRKLMIQSLQQHRDQPTQVRDHNFDVGIARWDLLHNQVQDDDLEVYGDDGKPIAKLHHLRQQIIKTDGKPKGPQPSRPGSGGVNSGADRGGGGPFYGTGYYGGGGLGLVLIVVLILVLLGKL